MIYETMYFFTKNKNIFKQMIKDFNDPSESS